MNSFFFFFLMWTVFKVFIEPDNIASALCFGFSATRYLGSHQGSNSHPLHWKHKVLTAGLLRRSLDWYFEVSVCWVPIVHRLSDLYILTGPCSILDQPCGYDQNLLGCACLGQPSGVRVRVRVRVYPLFLCPSSLLDPRLFFCPRGHLLCLSCQNLMGQGSNSMVGED